MTSWSSDGPSGGVGAGEAAMPHGDRDEAVARLAEILPGRVVTDPAVLEAYRRDQTDLCAAGMPAALVRATSLDDVVTTMRWASKERVPVVARGAGTGLSGGAMAIDGGIVVSLERMTAIRGLWAEDQVIEVEAGVVNAEVGRLAAAHDLFYPPDPSSFEVSTIGGNIATNAGGLRCVKYGVTRDSVLGLEVVLADGRVLRTGGRTVKNVAGYDLTRLFVGSEGTLGIITAAILRLRPIPKGLLATFVASFPDVSAVGRAVSSILASGSAPSLLELLDGVAIDAIERFSPMGLDRSAAALLIGQLDDADSENQAAAMAGICLGAGADMAISSTDPAEADMLLQARRIAAPALKAMGPIIIDDVGVPRSRLGELLEYVQTVAAATGLRIACVGHAGDGNIHPTIVLPDPTPATLERAMAAARRICDGALSMGGTITGEHGIGSLKRDWLRAELSETSLEVHQSLKQALDPLGILNPGRAF